MSDTTEGWTPVHHEEYVEPPAEKPKPAAKPKAPNGKAGKGDPAIVMTFPPNMIAGIWSLTEALEENTKATRELLEELRASRQKAE